jgi:hypothetical protein
MPGPNDAYIFQFERNYDHLFQQEMSRLEQFVRVQDGVTGTMVAFGLLGPSGEPEDITNERHGETTFSDDPSYRRWAVRQDKQSAAMLDRQDDLSVLVNLQMGYARNRVAAMNRIIDKIIINAVTATAVSGATGTGTSAYLTTAPDNEGGGGNQIPVGGSGMLIDKMRDARSYFDAREVGLDDMEMGQSPFVWLTNPVGHKHLLQQTEATSTDYLGVEVVNGTEVQSRMPLVRGRIQRYMGFFIKVTNQLNKSGADFINLAWHRDAVGFARWGGRKIVVEQNIILRNLASAVVVQESFGAVRIHDAGVLSIVCSPTL